MEYALNPSFTDDTDKADDEDDNEADDKHTSDEQDSDDDPLGGMAPETHHTVHECARAE